MSAPADEAPRRKLADEIVLGPRSIRIDGQAFPWHVDERVYVEADGSPWSVVVLRVFASRVVVEQRSPRELPIDWVAPS